MQKKIDRRVRKTKRLLKTSLARLMQTKPVSQITVKELVDEADINRSTFYLHYRDISCLLKEIEEETIEEIKRAISEHPIGLENQTTLYFIEEVFRVMEAHREIGCALIGQYGDIGFIQRVLHIIEENSRELLKGLFPGSEKDLKYFYSFCLDGCLGLIRTWMLEGQDKSPEFIAQLTFQMIVNAMNAFCNVTDVS